MNYTELIEPLRVHSSLYTDPAIFADELERIWYRTWVFVGHTSEGRVVETLRRVGSAMLRRITHCSILCRSTSYSKAHDRASPHGVRPGA
jgi:hypothetical protein